MSLYNMWSYPAVNRWPCPFVPMFEGGKNIGMLFTPMMVAE